MSAESWAFSQDKLEFQRVQQRVLRYVTSVPGREVLEACRVSSDRETIRRQLASVSEMKRFLEEYGDFPLGGIHPVRSAIQKSGIEGAMLQPRELAHVASTLRAARIVRDTVMRLKGEWELLRALAASLVTDKVLEFNIDKAIDESGAVRTSASRELQNVRRAIAETSDQLRKRLVAILRTVTDLGFSQEEIITTREGRMVIPMKSEHRGRVPGFIHSASASGATVFVEPTETLDLNNEIRNLQFVEQREVEKILRALTEQVRGHREDLLSDLGILAELDALHSRARYSIEILGIAPDVETDGPLRLVGARHPVLLQNHGYAGTVPLDIELGGDFTTLVISGPNAGGKSVAMKCVGLLALMTQSGLHIPAQEGTRMRVFNTIHVDIGDEQSIDNDLSTFSSHLRNLNAIADSADDRSLVLIDEIGSGTDPAEGGAIAAAVLEWLTGKGALTIATTHHSALKVFAHETAGVRNGAMEFDIASLTPTYRFRGGVPGSSYALEMARRLNFAGEILNRAGAYLGGHQARLESLLSELETAAQQTRREYDHLLEEKNRVDGMAREYRQKMSSLSAELKEMKRKAVQEAADIVERANATIERSVREIRESHARPEAVRAAHTSVEELKHSLTSERADLGAEPPPSLPHAIEVGSFVTLGTGEDAGEVLAVSPDGTTATVVFGAVRMRVRRSDLQPTSRRPRLRATGTGMEEKSDPISTTLDIRGMMGDEALPLLDKFLDTAILAGLHRVDIIHGKGTGALRKKVTEFLGGHSRVVRFRLGELNEGGAGATVVELKDQP